MSGDLHITFAPDLPAMAVEVIAPDLSIVKRMMMQGSQQATVAVPSEMSLLRVYLPSGRAVTLPDRGSLNRVVTRDAVQFSSSPSTAPPPPIAASRPSGAAGASPARASRAPAAAAAPAPAPPTTSSRPSLSTRRDVRRYHVWRASAAPDRQREDQELPLGDRARARVVDADGQARTAAQGEQPNEILWQLDGPSFERPFDLTVEQDDGRRLLVRIPGNAHRLWARVDALEVENALNYSVRVQSSEPVADTINNYLCRGDLAAAGAMADWADESEKLLMSKMSDPYAAAVGAYLLLKLQRFDQLRDWPRNLAHAFEFLPDGCILWASQLIQQDPGKEREIRKYLLLAAERGLPIYTAGLRLLLDNLRLLGEDGEAAAKKLRAQLGQVIWESPLTARMTAREGSRSQLSSNALTFDIEFGATA